jgi:hypothetical protein
MYFGSLLRVLSANCVSVYQKLIRISMKEKSVELATFEAQVVRYLKGT